MADLVVGRSEWVAYPNNKLTYNQVKPILRENRYTLY